MGIQDRDWYIEAQKEKEKQESLERTKRGFQSFSKKTFESSAGGRGHVKDKTPQLGLIPMMLFWFAVMGILYGLMTYYMKPKAPQIVSNGDLVLHRANDGHFYAPGSVNGHEVIFMVDTGATHVAVSEDVARKALLDGGVRTRFMTANGEREGRLVSGVNVSFGPVSVTNVTVGTGISMGRGQADALLGQSFLSKFSVTMNGNLMTMRRREDAS